MLRLRKDDMVYVIAGKDKGKKGKVLSVLPQLSKAMVEGINLVKKARRKTQQEQQAGIIDIESPIAISNLAIFCKSCNKPVRVGVRVSEDGSKNRFCKKCEAII
jgi:large subunit ribosomal protein L24